MDSLKVMSFSRNVIACVLDWKGFYYDESLLIGQQQEELFETETETAVSWSLEKIIQAKFDVIHKMFNEFKLHENWKDPSYFGSLILQAAPTFFQHGYSPEHFLAFCAVAIGVVVLYYDYEEVNRPDFANKAANVIGLVLTGHMMTGDFFRGGSWKRLCEIANAVILAAK